MSTLKKVTRLIDLFIDRTGRIFSFAVLGILAVILYEVLLRRIFNSPQIWTQDMIIMLFACYIILVCAYGFQKKAFVAVDVLFARLSRSGQHRLHLITYLVFFVPFIAGLLPKSWSFFYKALVTGEKSYSVWGPPTWPMKLCLFVGLLLLALQGISEILKQVTGLIEVKSRHSDGPAAAGDRPEKKSKPDKRNEGNKRPAPAGREASK